MWDSFKIVLEIRSNFEEYFLVIRQKGESQNRCFKKKNTSNFPKKLTFLTPRYAQVRVRIRGVEMFVFSENLTRIFFLKHPFSDLPFCFINDDFLIRNLG